MNSIEELIQKYENEIVEHIPVTITYAHTSKAAYSQGCIDSISNFIEDLKNLPNELRAVNRNEQAKEICLFCGKEIENPKVLTVCNKCLDEYYSKQTG